MLSKKGIIEIKFNWIFILIAGALILAFFGSVSIRGKQSASDLIAEHVLSNMDEIVILAEASKQTSISIQVPEEKISFGCSSISVGRFSKSFPDSRIVFSPKDVKSSYLTMWTLDFNIPQYISNFIFITPPEVIYFFIDDYDPETQRIHDIIPEQIRKGKAGNIPHYQQMHGENIRYVFFEEENVPDYILKNYEEGLPSVRIDRSSGKVYFYEEDGVKEADFIGDAMLFGAVFSKDYDYYSCVSERVLERINIVNKVYRHRSARFYYAYQSPCKPKYSPSYFAEASSLGEARQRYSIIEQNNYFLEQNSCPVLY